MNMPLIPPDVIASAFKTEKDKALDEALEKKRQERLETLINHVKKNSPTGKKLIEEAQEKGVTFYMDTLNANTLGVFSGSTNSIALNESFSNDKLVSTLVHEARHANQDPPQNMNSDVHSMVSCVRAMEADAMAHECAAVFEMGGAPMSSFLLSHRHISSSYHKGLKKTKDKQEALTEAFKAWYDDKAYVSKYDEKTIETSKIGQLMKEAYTHKVTPEMLSQAVPYIEPKFFPSERANTMEEKLVKKAQKVEKKHIRHAFNFFHRSKIETSSDLFYVRKEQGKIDPPKREAEQAHQKAQSAKNPSPQKLALTALQQKRGR